MLHDALGDGGVHHHVAAHTGGDLIALHRRQQVGLWAAVGVMEAKPTMAFRYKFYVSADGKNWKEVPANGEFSNIMHNPLPQTVTFGQKEKARFIKLEATTPTATTAQVEMNEIGVTVAP